jgi:hypothetical protein
MACAADRHDGEIKIGSEPAIDAQLFTAIVAAQRQRAEVDEGQLDGLFDLVRVTAGQQHPRDVSLDESYPRDPTAIAARIEQRLRQLRRFTRLRLGVALARHVL